MNNSRSQVVCFGEILWDILPGGTVPGGAPMNVAYHLHQLKESPALITRVGNDEKGEELKKILAEKQIDTSLLQTDLTRPTGIVYGTANERGDMKYEIVAPSAWDFIEATAAAIEKVRASAYFVCGSLAARDVTSQLSLFTFLAAAKTSVVDINLRQPFFGEALIGQLLQHAAIAKLNSDELDLLSRWWAIEGDLKDRMSWLQQRFNLDTVIVTRGAEGAAVFHEDSMYEHPGYKVNVVDTVGSGDAFLAGFLHRRLQKDSISNALNFASRLGAFVASRSGAWPAYTLRDIEQLLYL
ncbi:carbohydrate kinase [Terrimonas sp. NA20]|uniref:Carbohydrate kinase n=1 Tax=Terrimonas ginsenosidimutans TaxID=2908004 RepID=A0ABS9KZ68_9BACT|nr:carbohydrate kinase [Terrimonas ginsenosidimutans]MCG2617514.1 carbohydrate kinase [Terrimonas ginsenosidimutans]